jgi:hypothetical protein
VVLVRMTKAEAARAGITAEGVPLARAKPLARARPAPYLTRCHECGETFTKIVDEDRHVAATLHARYELLID